jgi:hypothetical protein
MRTPRFFRKASHWGRESATDLQTQMESILDCVWHAERNWRLMDRIDFEIAVEEQRRLHRMRRGLREGGGGNV